MVRLNYIYSYVARCPYLHHTTNKTPANKIDVTCDMP